MYRRFRAEPKHAFAGLAFLSALIAPPAVHAEIFRCATEDGAPLYQNFPCDIESLGSLPCNRLAADAPTAKTPSIARSAGPEKSKIPHIDPASIVKSTHTGELRVGMSSDEVRRLLGEPEEMVDDEPAEGGRVSLWRFADGRFVQFDHKHRVLEIRR